MVNTVWYWEYQLKFWNEIDYKEEIRSGVVAADTMTEAMQDIEEYYGKDIMEIQMLKPIVYGIFEFQNVMEDTDFNYIISKKYEGE